MKQYEKGDSRSLSTHFRVSEFACRGDGCCSTLLIDDQLVAHLQAIRDHFGKPVYINSGYRCKVHNEKVGGAVNSRHTKGQAADIAVRDIAPAEVAKFAESIGILGIGLYETDQDGYFVHIDTRPYRSFWYGQKQARRESFGGYDFFTFVEQLQQALGITADGIPGKQTLAAAPTLGQSWNATHPAVLPVQKRLSSLGYSQVGEPDGVAGPKFQAALAQFQRDHGLSDTGIAEHWGRTWQVLLGLTEGVMP